jgi:cell division protein FtsN
MKKSTARTSRSHLGGTLTGFVIGLLVGLGAALAVAVYVTRVPVPFVDRGLSRSAEDDAKEAERNKGWNPNNAITGAPAPGAAPAAAPAAEGAIVVPPADGQTLPAPGTARPAAPAADPLGDLVNSRLGQGGAAPAPATAGASPTAPAPGADPFTYFVQAGAFRNAGDAEAQRARLAMLGITGEVSEREQNGRTVYRVRVGPFAQKALADLTLEQLEVSGVEAALVRVQR